MASAPEPHSPTSSTCGSRASSTRRLARASGSSSTMSARHRHAARLAPGQADRHAHAAAVDIGDVQRGVGAVQAAQPVAHVAQADRAGARRLARAAADGVVGGDGRAVVVHLEHQARRACARPAISTAPGCARRAMPCLIAFSTSGCRIRRGTSARPIRRNAKREREPVAEADLLDVEVHSREAQLLGERHLLRAAPCSEWRRKSLTRAIVSTASSSCCSRTRPEIALSALNRKCGSTWWRSASSRACASWRARSAGRCAAQPAVRWTRARGWPSGCSSR